MTLFLNLKRVLKEGWNNFVQDKNSLFSVLPIIVIVLLLFTSLFLTQEATQFLVDEIKHKMNVSVYFKSDSPEERILEARDKIKSLPEVKEVEYVSKEEALKRFKSEFEHRSRVMEALNIVGGNPLLASLNIQTFEEAQYEAVDSFLNKSSFKDLIHHSNYHQSKEIIARVYSITSAANTGLLGLAIILGIIAVLVVFNTIKLSIIGKSNEISIMRLVGSQNWFIRGPFVVQGLLIGFSGVLITMLIFSLGLYYLSPSIQNIIPGLDLFTYFLNKFWVIASIQLGAGLGLTVLSSLIATRKYLKI